MAAQLLEGRDPKSWEEEGAASQLLRSLREDGNQTVVYPKKQGTHTTSESGPDVVEAGSSSSIAGHPMHQLRVALRHAGWAFDDAGVGGEENASSTTSYSRHHNYDAVVGRDEGALPPARGDHQEGVTTEDRRLTAKW